MSFPDGYGWKQIQKSVQNKHLRALASGSPLPDISNDLSALVGTFLQQVSSVVNGTPLPISPQLIGWGAIRLRHEGGKLGDFTKCSLQAMLFGSEEMRAFAQYCCRLADGGSAVPVPDLTQ
ncbi:MAG TPA: hypothetical protein VI636_25150, partial [Candidatus Angelobacter sp.]